MKKDTHTILRRPRITEKASISAEKGVFVFEIDPAASKKAVAHAVKELYKVTPVKVATVTTPAKRVFVRGKWGKKVGIKKAYVYLKKGDTIEFV